MLVLSRKKGEEIRIGDDIIVTVHRLSGNRVSIGIQAPTSCRIIRGELQAAVEAFEVPEASAEDAPEISPSRPLGTLLTKKLGGNRITAHLPTSMRAAK